MWSDEDNCYISTIKEFPGLSGLGETRSESIKQAEVALEGFLKVYEEDGCQLPEPNIVKQYSGQTRVRLPKSLHESLSNEAEIEGVSLNTHIIHLLSERHYLKKIEKELRDVKTCMQLYVIDSFMQDEWATSDATSNTVTMPIANLGTGAWDIR